MTLFENLIPWQFSESLTPVFIVWLALALEKFVRMPSSIDPLALFGFICQRMAKKVLKQNSSYQQIVLAGALGFTVLTLPVLIIFYLIREFAGYQFLFDTLVLWILCQYTRNAKVLSKGIAALKSNKKQLAKEWLQSQLLRQTSLLSPLGLNKAALEGVLLRYHHQQFTVICIYLILGPTAALAYRLAYEAQHAWNPKLAAYSKFGWAVNKMTGLLQALTCVFFGLSFMLVNQPYIASKALFKREFWRDKSAFVCGFLWQCQAIALGVNLGGPVMYNQTKSRRQRFYAIVVHPQEPDANTVKTLIKQINKHLIVSMLVLTWIVFWLSDKAV